MWLRARVEASWARCWERDEAIVLIGIKVRRRAPIFFRAWRKSNGGSGGGARRGYRRAWGPRCGMRIEIGSAEAGATGFLCGQWAGRTRKMRAGENLEERSTSSQLVLPRASVTRAPGLEKGIAGGGCFEDAADGLGDGRWHRLAGWLRVSGAGRGSMATARPGGGGGAGRN